MSEAEVIEIVKNSLNELLRWVGFGTLTGLAAKAIMPGRDPGGAVGTMLWVLVEVLLAAVRCCSSGEMLRSIRSAARALLLQL